MKRVVRTKFVFRAYFLALWPSEILGFLNYRRPVCSIYCLLSPYFHLLLPNFLSNHLSLGLPILLPPTGLLPNNVLPALSWSIFTVCLIRSNILILISATISNSLYIPNFIMILVSLSTFRREFKFVYLCACWPSINTLQVVVSFRSTVIVNVINKCFIVSINKKNEIVA